MYIDNTGSYDEIPDGMKRYLNNYGCHFNKKLCEEAVDRMRTKNDEGKEVKIKSITKEDVEKLMRAYNVNIKRNKLYDAVYVINMAKADFYHSSIEDEEHLIKYVKDLLDDVDAKEGFVFNRFYADTIFINNPIEWEDMV